MLTASVLFTVLFLFSCKKIDDTEFNKGDTILAINVNKSSLMLEEKNHSADAFIFNWTTGTNKGTNASISYTLKIDKQGSNFSNALVEQPGKSVLSKKYTVKEFNDLLLTKWQVAPGTETSMEARVIATVADNAAPADSATISFKVKPYKPVTTTLYLIGDATPNGWNAGNATPLTAVPNQPGKFTWQGNLSAGDFKFITTLGQFLPSYNKGGSNTSLIYRTADAQPDEKFKITAAGSYAVAVDLLNLSITLAEGNNPPYTKLWIVGAATPNGWNIDNPNQMRVDSSNLWVFNYNEVLKSGEFKIPVSTGNWGTDYYMPLTNHQSLTATDVQLVPGGNPDKKWEITNAGPYKIKLDLQNNKIRITPFTPYTQIWMVGDATPVGWNINDPQLMTATAGDPYVFTYEGPMNAGEFKFPIAKGNWGTDYFMPGTDQSGAGSTQVKFVTGGNPDHKWRLIQAGNYKITLDQLRETISIVKL